MLQEFILKNIGNLQVEFKRVMHQAGIYSLFNSLTGIIDPKIGMSMRDMVQHLEPIFDEHSFKCVHSLATDDDCFELVAHILDDLVKAFFPSLHHHPDHHGKRRRFIALQLVEAKYACNLQSITGTILERLTYFLDQPIQSILINFDSDSSRYSRVHSSLE